MTTCTYLENKENIPLFRYSDQVISRYLKVLMNIPYLSKELIGIEQIDKAIDILISYQHKSIVIDLDNEEVRSIINSLDFNEIFELTLSKVEKDYCESEFNKYLANPKNYQLPDLDKIIDNGEYLKCYIEYKIEEYKTTNLTITCNSKDNLLKKI